MNRLTAKPGSSVPVEEIEFKTSVQSGNTSGRVETTLLQKLSPKKIQANSKMYLKHMPTPTRDYKGDREGIPHIHPIP